MSKTFVQLQQILENEDLKEYNNILNADFNDLKQLLDSEKMTPKLFTLILICVYNGTDTVFHKQEFIKNFFGSNNFKNFWQEKDFTNIQTSFKILNKAQAACFINDLIKNNIDDVGKIVLFGYTSPTSLTTHLLNELGSISIKDYKAFKSLAAIAKYDNKISTQGRKEIIHSNVILRTVINLLDDEYSKTEQIFQDLDNHEVIKQFLEIIESNFCKHIFAYEVLNKYTKQFADLFIKFPSLKIDNFENINSSQIGEHIKFSSLLKDYENYLKSIDNYLPTFSKEPFDLDIDPIKISLEEIIYDNDEYDFDITQKFEPHIKNYIDIANIFKGAALKSDKGTPFGYVVYLPKGEVDGIIVEVYGGWQASSRVEKLEKVGDLYDLDKALLKQKKVIAKLNLPDLLYLKEHQSKMPEVLLSKILDCIYKFSQMLHHPELIHPSLEKIVGLPTTLYGASFGGNVVMAFAGTYSDGFDNYITFNGGLFNPRQREYKLSDLKFIKYENHLSASKYIKHNDKKVLCIVNFNDHNVLFNNLTNYHQLMNLHNKGDKLHILINDMGEKREDHNDGHFLSKEVNIFNRTIDTICKFNQGKLSNSIARNDLEIFIKKLYWDQYHSNSSVIDIFISKIFCAYNTGKISEDTINDSEKICDQLQNIFYSLNLDNLIKVYGHKRLSEKIGGNYILSSTLLSSALLEHIREKVFVSDESALNMITKAISLDFDNFIKYQRTNFKDIKNFIDLPTVFQKQTIDLYKSWIGHRYPFLDTSPEIKFQNKLFKNILMSNLKLFDTSDESFLNAYKNLSMPDLWTACAKAVQVFKEYKDKVINLFKSGDNTDIGIDHRIDFMNSVNSTSTEEKNNIDSEIMGKNDLYSDQHLNEYTC